MNIKNMVKDNTAKFVYYRDNQLWYIVEWMEDETYDSLIFPVPIDDIGNATFSHTEKALLMMRYIRKHIKTIEQGK